MVKVTRDEALQIIKSLSSQMLMSNNANTERKEFYDDEGKYFSILVTPMPKRQKDPCPTCGCDMPRHYQGCKFCLDPEL